MAEKLTEARSIIRACWRIAAPLTLMALAIILAATGGPRWLTFIVSGVLGGSALGMAAERARVEAESRVAAAFLKMVSESGETTITVDVNHRNLPGRSALGDAP